MRRFHAQNNLKKNERKQNRGFKGTGRRNQTERWATERAEVEVQMESRREQVSGRMKRNRKAGIVCPAQGIVPAEPHRTIRFCVRGHRRNMMFLHGGCGQPKLKLHSHLKNSPTHLFLCLDKICRVALQITPWWSSGHGWLLSPPQPGFDSWSGNLSAAVIYITITLTLHLNYRINLKKLRIAKVPMSKVSSPKMLRGLTHSDTSPLMTAYVHFQV